MAATVSAWGKPGAWALDSEENESELLQAHKEDSSAANGNEKSDYPSLSAAATSQTKKNKPQKLSFQEFSAYSAPKPAAQTKGLTHDELIHLPTGPRERSAEELDRSKLGGGFRSYGGGGRDEQPRRQGSFKRDSDREFAPSRADETDDWGAGKKSSSNNVSDRRERGERGGGFFSDSQSRADDVSNWSSNKSSAPPEPKRYEKRGSFGSESSNGGGDSGNWGKKREEEGRRSGGGGGGAFDSLRERRGGHESNTVDSDNWGKKTEEVSGGGTRPRLNLQPRTVGPNGGEKSEINATIVKPKGSSPFGDARPREEVLKEIEEKLDSVKINDVVSADPVDRKADSHSQSVGETENGSAEKKC